MAFVANILGVLFRYSPIFRVQFSSWLARSLLPRHSSNSSHVIAENETNFCNLIAFRVDGVSKVHWEKVTDFGVKIWVN